jgi:hypothetical protein
MRPDVVGAGHWNVRVARARARGSHSSPVLGIARDWISVVIGQFDRREAED